MTAAALSQSAWTVKCSSRPSSPAASTSPARSRTAAALSRVSAARRSRAPAAPRPRALSARPDTAPRRRPNKQSLVELAPDGRLERDRIRNALGVVARGLLGLHLDFGVLRHQVFGNR